MEESKKRGWALRGKMKKKIRRGTGHKIRKERVSEIMGVKIGEEKVRNARFFDILSGFA